MDKIVWAWDKPWSDAATRIKMGTPKYEGIYGWQLLESGEGYCQFCDQKVPAPHSHSKPEFDKYKQCATITQKLGQTCG